LARRPARHAIAACLLFAALAQGQSSLRWNVPPEQPLEGVQHGTFTSASMDLEVGYNVLLPEGYGESEERYPVVYWLHGLGGNENSGARLAGVIQTLVDENEIEPMLFVFVNGGANTMYADSADGEIKAETSIIKELIPHIDGKYRTIAERRGRAIEGFSMGGYGALMLGAKHPELFCSIVAYAGALHDQESLSTGRAQIYQQMFASEEAFENSSPYYWIRKNSQRIRETLPIRMVIGTRDQTMGYNEKFREVLRELEIPHEYEIVEGMGHNIAGYYDAVGVKGLRFLTGHFDGDRDR
jgi:endo-1,4-beta-xylanase